MNTTLSSPITSLQRDPDAAASGAHRSPEEQETAANQHADAPILTDQVADEPVRDLLNEAAPALQNARAVSDEWLEAGRTVVRTNPLLAIGGAALIGVALTLATSRVIRR